jgi:hypothetical protein
VTADEFRRSGRPAKRGKPRLPKRVSASAIHTRQKQPHDNILTLSADCTLLMIFMLALFLSCNCYPKVAARRTLPCLTEYHYHARYGYS